MVEQHSVSRDWSEVALREAFGSRVEFGVELATHTSYRTGGKARAFVRAENPDDIVRDLEAVSKLQIPFFLLGGGSNVLFSDAGYDGVIIKIDVAGLALESEAEIEVGAGEELMALVDFATGHSLSGLEFASGIWGTVGGAICGNAGAYGSDIGSVLSTVTLVDADGKLRTESTEYCQFGYRTSRFKTSGEVVVSARLSLSKAEQKAVRDRVKEILISRKGKHPVDGMSAGCFFKNVPDVTQPHGKLAAGKLLDEAGAKELSIGGAKVFEKHANIIVNTGTATSKDIRRLADMMKQKVKDQFGVELQEEVVCVGDF